MTQHPLTILYIGDKRWGEALQQSASDLNWHVYRPVEMLEALGIYISLFPEVVVLDAAANEPFVQEIYAHLQSVNAEPVIVLSDGTQPDWVDTLAGDYVISRDADLETVIEAISEFASGNLIEAL